MFVQCRDNQTCEFSEDILYISSHLHPFINFLSNNITNYDEVNQRNVPPKFVFNWPPSVKDDGNILQRRQTKSIGNISHGPLDHTS